MNIFLWDEFFQFYWVPPLLLRLFILCLFYPAIMNHVDSMCKHKRLEFFLFYHKVHFSQYSRSQHGNLCILKSWMKDNVCKTKLKQQKCNALTIMMVLSIVVDVDFFPLSLLSLLLLFVIGASGWYWIS